MATWLTYRDDLASANYRAISFKGGRILQARELNDLQSVDEKKNRYVLSSLFREGSTFNVKAEISGNNLILSRANADISEMLVFFNGVFEPLAEQTIPLPPVQASGDEVLYLHWVLWRVTADGQFEGQPGCLMDISLTDPVTGEIVSERGQLQFKLSFDEDLSNEAIDAVRMLAKSTAAVPVFYFSWTATGLISNPADAFQPYLGATTRQTGVVYLNSDDADGIAVGADDARLTDERTPLDDSVTNPKVTYPVLDQGLTEIGSKRVAPGTDGGIDSAKIWWSGLQARVSDTLSWLYAKVLGLLGLTAELDDRVTILENEPDPTFDFSFHVGKPVVSSEAHAHDPLVVDSEDGWRHVGEDALLSDKYAYSTETAAGVRKGGLLQNGNYLLSNPTLAANIAAANGGEALNDFYSLAMLTAKLRQLLAGIMNSLLDVLTLGGDISGPATANRVVKMQGVPFYAKRANNAEPQNNDVVTFQNGVLRLVPFSQLGTLVSPPGPDITPVEESPVSTLRMWHYPYGGDYPLPIDMVFTVFVEPLNTQGGSAFKYRSTVTITCTDPLAEVVLQNGNAYGTFPLELEVVNGYGQFQAVFRSKGNFTFNAVAGTPPDQLTGTLMGGVVGAEYTILTYELVGSWDPDTEYGHYDAVEHRGKVYASRIDGNIGHDPQPLSGPPASQWLIVSLDGWVNRVR